MSESSKPIKAKSVSKSTGFDKHPGGRPSKYKPEYCEQIVEFCEKGASLTAFAASISVAKDTLVEWGIQHKEFSVAMRKAKTKAEAYFEKLGVAGMTGQIKGFNGGMHNFWMMARFGWKTEPEPEAFEETQLKFTT
jgi:hypothetical protein